MSSPDCDLPRDRGLRPPSRSQSATPSRSRSAIGIVPITARQCTAATLRALGEQREQPHLIRDADPARDAAACAAVYAPFVTDSAASFEERPPTPEEFGQRIERISKTHPWLVADDAGRVVGFAYGCPHRERAAYRWAADVSVYVAPVHQRRGIGRALYSSLLPFRRFQFYHPQQNGSASMKAVLPALTGRGYDELAIQDGGMASLEFLRVHFGSVSDEERERVRRQLEEYCGLDTIGMAWIVDALRRLAEG